MARRTADFLIALILLALLAIPCLLIAVLIRLTSKGPAIYWSDRVGLGNSVFQMPKFRTMYVGTPSVATHLLAKADSYVTPVGKLLRKTSLDELPQIWSVLKGDMSVVGPRPALFNQHDLIALRTQHGVHRIRPGITGWAQVNGRDELSIAEKVEFDRQYLERRSLGFDLRILILTVVHVVQGEGISH